MHHSNHEVVTVRRGRACAPHTLRHACREHTQEMDSRYITRQARDHFVFRKKTATWPAPAEEKSPTFDNAVLQLGNTTTWRAGHCSHHGLGQSSVASDHGVAPRNNTRLCRWNWVQPVLGNLQNVIKVKLILCIKSVIGRKQSETL